MIDRDLLRQLITRTRARDVAASAALCDYL